MRARATRWRISACHARRAPGLAAAALAATCSIAAPVVSFAENTGSTDARANAEEKAAELAPIVIDAEAPQQAPLVERSFETAEDVTGFGETIFAEPIWRGFESTAELLGQSVGAQLLRQGGRDDFATLTLRGAPSAQLRILLDGIALGRASESVVNLADLPLDTVDRIEVYRGFAPVGLSASSAAGVVNIITRDPDKPTASAAAGGGSFGTAKINAGGAGPVAGGSASAFVSYRRTDGDFDYVDDNGTIFKPEDDRVRSRRNNQSDAFENLLRWRTGVFDAARLQLRNHVFYKDEGVPGLARCPDDCFSPRAQLETVRNIAAAAIGSSDRRWSVEESVTAQSKKLSDYPGFDNTSDTTASSTTARWGTAIGKANWFSGSGDFTWEGFDQDSENTLALPNQHAERSTIAVAAGDDWTIDRLNTTLNMQLRFQQLWNSSSAGSGDTASSTDPRIGLRWKPVEGLAIKANVSSYFRPPSFDELYGVDGFTTGNPLLEPEDGIAYDAGLEWTVERRPFGKFAAGYSWFGSDVDDIILVRLTFDRTAKAFNASRARIRGHEARVEWQGPAGFALSANYTFQHAEDRSDSPVLFGKDLAGIPPHEAWVRLSWARGLFVVATDLDVTGSHYVDPENHQKLPTRTAVGVQVVYGPFWKGLRLTLEGENLGDSLVPDQIGFPLPGRAFYATLSWSAEQD